MRSSLRYKRAPIEPEELTESMTTGRMPVSWIWRDRLTMNLDTLDKQLRDLEAKAKAAPAKSKADMDAKISSLHVQRDAFAADFSSLASASVASWAMKSRLDKEWSELKSAADKV